MNDVMYKIVFEGDLMPGYEQSTVQKRLAELFKLETTVAARLFIGKPRDVKCNVSFDQAKKYVRAMSKVGALAFMLPHEEEETLVPRPDLGGNTGQRNQYKENAFSAYFENKVEKPDVIDLDATHDVTPMLLETEWDEVSGERKVRDIERISKQILQQRKN